MILPAHSNPWPTSRDVFGLRKLFGNQKTLFERAGYELSPVEHDYKLQMLGKADGEWVSFDEILSSERFVTEQITTSLDRNKRSRKLSADSGTHRLGLMADNKSSESLSDDSLSDYDEDTPAESLFIKAEQERANVFMRLLNSLPVIQSIRASVRAIKRSLTDGLLYHEE